MIDRIPRFCVGLSACHIIFPDNFPWLRLNRLPRRRRLVASDTPPVAPDVSSWRGVNAVTMFYAIRNNANRIILRMTALTMELIKGLRGVEVEQTEEYAQ